MKLSIIIPCYNEEKTIKPLLNKIFKIKFPIAHEIIVIDDGSDINHRELLEEEIKAKKVKFIRLHQNQGKGVAIRIGLKYATGDIFVIQDADLEYFPEDLLKLLNPILKWKVNVVYGTRFAKKPKEMAKSHYFANRFLTKATNFLYNVNLSDMETGYKLFTKKILEKIELNAREFEFEPEITAKIILNGHKIKELPIIYHTRRKGSAKINLFDGLEGFLILLKFRFFENSKIFHIFYKIFKFHFKKIGIKLIKFV